MLFPCIDGNLPVSTSLEQLWRRVSVVNEEGIATVTLQLHRHQVVPGTLLKRLCFPSRLLLAKHWHEMN